MFVPGYDDPYDVRGELNFVKTPKTQPKQAKPGRAPISMKRLWVFRLIALGLPFVMLAALEGILRVKGYGYPTTFFLRQRIGDQDYYVPNDRFGFRFFPPAIARTPFALRMPAKKPMNTCRIFLFGESAAQGDPDPTFGVGRYLQTLLRERFPGKDFEVVCVAMTAINSHAILPIARECARYDGDLWIVYMGNNEIVGPFGAGTVFGPQASGLWAIRTSLAARTTRSGQLVESLAGRAGAPGAAQKSWGGLGMFKEHQVRFAAPARQRAYQNFAGNLEDILRAGRKAGVPVVLSTVASNLKDCAPFASLHKAALSADEQSAWDRSFQAGMAAQTGGDYRGALKVFSEAAAVDSEFAELRFRQGLCELALTNLAEAKRDFELARDYDALGFRADGPINGIIKQAAGHHAKSGVSFVDADAALAAASPFGISGEELFYEHVHLNFDGNYRLARIFAEQVAARLPTAVTNRGQAEWVSAQVCDRRLAVSPWDRYRVWQANFSRVSEPPFTDQLNDVPRAKMYMAKLAELRADLNPDAQARARTAYQEAVAAAPDDLSLRGNYAQFLGEAGDFAEAVKQQQRVCELLPQSAPAFHKCGLLLVRQNQMQAAAEQFAHCLGLRGDYAPALNELGQIRAQQQKLAEAEKLFREAIKLKPGYAETYVNLGFMEQGAGRLSEGLAHYQEAARLQPNGPAAHFSQAVSLAAEHRRGDAIKLFQAAVWMNPEFWQARYLLGVEVALADQPAEAEQQFAEVVRLRPDFVKGRINLGVALGKRRKIEEALLQFQAALRLSPTNESARRNLELLQTLKARLP
jgi:tetratricopeptide (TPR) repeat protein